MAEQFQRAAIVGLGLLGGSLAMVLRKKRLVQEVVGIDSDETVLAKAVHRDIVDRAETNPERGLSLTRLAVLAVPTYMAPDVLVSISPYLEPGTVVCDVGRIKAPVMAKAAEVLSPETPFVGCHPVVPKEGADLDEAYPALFKGRPCILASGEVSTEEALRQVKEIWEEAGCQVEEMDAEIHDRLFAVLEDLPVLVLRSVSRAAGQVSGYVDDLEKYSSRELKEINRIVAAMSPHVAELFWANRNPLVHVLAYYRLKLREVSELLQEGTLQDLERFLGVHL
ncbi:MAG: prephenate dehydrogenase [Syntrophobacteria bacterium]